MPPPYDATRTHYDAFLARTYLWMTGGMPQNIEKASRFFTDHAISPAGTGDAVDLGAGCGFGAIALARSGYRVTAVDFSEPMLEALRQHSENLPVRTVQADILDFPVWSGLAPKVIACMGDTLTHLPDMAAVRLLIRQCSHELAPGGRIILSFRDYTKEPEGTVGVLPVRRDEDRIFLCRLAFCSPHVEVTDILYTRESGVWERIAGTYTKLMIRPETLRQVLDQEGMRITSDEMRDGFVTLIAQREPGSSSSNSW